MIEETEIVSVTSHNVILVFYFYHEDLDINDQF